MRVRHVLGRVTEQEHNCLLFSASMGYKYCRFCTLCHSLAWKDLSTSEASSALRVGGGKADCRALRWTTVPWAQNGNWGWPHEQ